MDPLSRRETLRRCVAGTGLVATAGCLSAADPSSTDRSSRSASESAASTASPAQTASATPTERATPTEARTPTDPIQVDLYNETDASRTIRYRIVGETGTVVDDEVSVPAAEFASVASNVRETGEYEFAFSAERIGEETVPFAVGDYAIRAGSNLVAWVREEEIVLAMEV